MTNNKQTTIKEEVTSYEGISRDHLMKLIKNQTAVIGDLGNTVSSQSHRIKELEDLLSGIVADAKGYEERSNKSVTWCKHAESVLKGRMI